MIYLRYKKALIVFTFFYTLFFIPIILFEVPYGFTSLIPFGSLTIHIPLLFGIAILGSIIGILAGFVSGPIALVLHVKILGRNKRFGIQSIPRSDKFTGITKAFLPMLFTTSIALVLSLSYDLAQNLVDPVFLNLNQGVFSVLLFAILIVLLSPIGMIFFSGSWFLEDAGVVYTNDFERKGNKIPKEVRNVGSWYNALFRGYAGIGVIVTFYFFAISTIQFAITDGYHPLFIAFVLFLPLVFTILAIPAIIVEDILYEKRVRYIHSLAQRIGIDNEVIIQFINKTTIQEES